MRAPPRLAQAARGRAGWVLAYFAVVGAPLMLMELGDVPPRDFWVEFSVALGFVGLAMIALQTVLTARVPRISLAVGQDRVLQFHRQVGLVAAAIILAHPAILLVVDSRYAEFLDPRAGLPRALALNAVLLALPLLLVTSLWRERFRLPYQWWRLSHALLAAFILVVSLVHIVQVDRHIASPWKQGFWAAIGAASVAGLAYGRVVKPAILRRRPYRVAAVERVGRRTWTVRLVPDRGPALDFRAGQFAFVTFAESPFSLEQHPFSIASSARDTSCLEFAVRELGDFTARIGELPVGQRAFVEGPFGALFVPSGDSADLALLAGGIGIAPLMSIVRTLRDDQDPRKVVLFHGADTPEDLVFAGELERLAQASGGKLTYVPVLRWPPPGWSGATGLITADLVAAYIPERERARWRYMVCGPAPMMEAAEAALVSLGAPLDRVDSERFDLGAASTIGRRHLRVRRTVSWLGVALVGIAAAVSL